MKQTGFVITILYLLERFREAGEGGRVVSPVLVVHAPPSLQAEEPLHRILGDPHEQLAAALGSDVLFKRVSVGGRPLFETIERILVLKQQVVPAFPSTHDEKKQNYDINP